MKVRARVLLPGILPDGSLTSWSATAETVAWPGEIDGYTEWAHLVELRPGIDSRLLPVVAAGWVDAATGQRLVRGFGGVADVEWTWAPSADWDEAAQCAVVTDGDSRREP